MSNLVNQLLETANPYTSLQKDAAKLAGKWSKSGLLEGISNETDKLSNAFNNCLSIKNFYFQSIYKNQICLLNIYLYKLYHNYGI